MKIRRVGGEFFHTDGRTDMTKLIVAFAILRTRLKLSLFNPNGLASWICEQVVLYTIMIIIVAILQQNQALLLDSEK
jgi:hypothetical protein